MITFSPKLLNLSISGKSAVLIITKSNIWISSTQIETRSPGFGKSYKLNQVLTDPAYVSKLTCSSNVVINTSNTSSYHFQRSYNCRFVDGILVTIGSQKELFISMMKSSKDDNSSAFTWSHFSLSIVVSLLSSGFGLRYCISLPCSPNSRSPDYLPCEQ